MDLVDERWEAKASPSSGNYHIQDSRGNRLAVVWARTDGQTAKPAKLIAASPKLLKALKAIIALADDGAYLDLADIEATPVSRQARAAIEAASCPERQTPESEE